MCCGMFSGCMRGAEVWVCRTVQPPYVDLGAKAPLAFRTCIGILLCVLIHSLVRAWIAVSCGVLVALIRYITPEVFRRK
jgi:hypothetical protein